MNSVKSSDVKQQEKPHLADAFTFKTPQTEQQKLVKRMMERHAFIIPWRQNVTKSFLQSMVNVDEEVELLKQEIKRLGTQKNGKYTVPFGVIVMDDRCSNIFEALVGTLRAAKKRKIIHFEGEMLLKGAHDNVEITLLQE